MAWIESHTVLMHHRKLLGLARALKIRRSYALGHLHALWHAVMEQQEDGDLTKWNDDMIAEASDFPGDAQQWVRMLQENGFMDGKILHDWFDYAGRYLTTRYRTADPKRLAEIKKKYEQSDYSQTKVGQHNLPNLPNQQIAQSSSCSAPTVALGVEVIRFPLAGKGELAITDGLFPLWRQAYPGIDLMAQLSKMRAWLLANPRKRKTEKGMPRFITAWLERAQNSNGGKQGNGADKPPRSNPQCEEAQENKRQMEAEKTRQLATKGVK